LCFKIVAKVLFGGFFEPTWLVHKKIKEWYNKDEINRKFNRLPKPAFWFLAPALSVKIIAL
jgi:hypothetical protein